MTSILCVRESDLFPLLDGPRSDLVGALNNHRTFSSKPKRIWQVDDNTRRVLNQYAEDAGIILEEKPIDFPPRMRWRTTPQDQLIALVPQEHNQFRANTHAQREMRTWTSEHGLEIVVEFGHGQHVKPHEDNQLHIVINGTPGTALAPEGEKEWRNLNYYQAYCGPFLPHSNTGQRLSNVIEQVRNTIYILAPIKQSLIANKLIIQALQSVKPDYSLMSPEERKRIMRARVHVFGERLVETVMRKHQNYQDRYDRIVQGMQQNLSTMERTTAEVRSLQKEAIRALDPQKMEETIRNRFEQLAAFDKIDEISIVDGRLRIRTVELIATNPSTKARHLMGAYEITFPRPDGGDWTPRIFNMTRRVNGHHHPHIQGRPCWGNMSEILPNLVFNGEYAAAISMLITYLETCNPTDPWGSSIGNWPVA